ncbi:hypothetical protein KP509_14G059500 [Ceratopteris richardii]|uniref:Uncharacterized protein n=1 Tax=Ceratopteris richardii TaxID=49495 RepID=A0A8T2TDG6_CERRI|nr:hypothetical protein KP509_14G059500 [Ceratopteris richardii]
MARRLAHVYLSLAVTHVAVGKHIAPLRLNAVAHRLLCFASHATSSFGPVSFSSSAFSKDGPRFPRAKEIPWQKELVNSVNLVGRIVGDIDITYLDSGKIVAQTSIKVAKYIDNVEYADIFQLQFQGDLAEIAAAHLKSEDQVYVSGSIWMESIMDKENHFITISKVVARDLKFAVLEKLESSPYASPTKIAEDEGEGHIPSKKSNVEDAWIELLKNPSSYWDNRDFKKSLKSPDFKHKATSLGLWISNTNTPPWVHDWLCSRRLYASIKEVFGRTRFQK